MAMMSGHYAKDYAQKDSSYMSDPNSAPSISKRIGEFLILGLYLVVDIEEIWPRSHFWALAAAVVGVLALLLLDGGFSRRMIAIISASTIATCSVVYLIAPDILPEETENHGWLLPANERSPAEPCPNVPKDALVFVAGTASFWTTSPGRSDVLSVGDKTSLSVERDGAKLRFNAEIYDDNGRLVARIIRNEFHLIQGQYSYRDRSEDRSKLTVFDGLGQEMLYINYVNSTTVVLRGKFSAPDGTKVVITDSGVSGERIHLSYVCIGNIGINVSATGTQLKPR